MNDDSRPATKADVELLERRLRAAEERQRAHGWHDPDCPVFVTQQNQRQTTMLLAVPECRCWLSRPTERLNSSE